MFVHVRPKSGGALYINTDHIVIVERVNNKVHFANGESVFLTQEGYADLMYEIWTYRARERGDASEDIETENEKLRELVRDMWRDGMCDCDERYTCTECEYGYHERMKELGIEVD